MQTVGVAELRKSLAKYLALVKRGEEIVIRDCDFPVAKLVPFICDDVSNDELRLVARGKMRVPQTPINIEELLNIPTGSVDSSTAIRAILDDREEGL